MVSDLVLLPVALVAFGVAGAYIGWKRRGVYAAVADVDPTPVAQIDSPGTVAVEGVARASDESFEAPVTGRDALAAAWTVEEWDERGKTSTWREVARGVEVAPFDVEGRTADATVAVEGTSKRDTAGKWTQTTGVSASDGVRMGDVLLEFEDFPVVNERGPGEEASSRLRALDAEHGLSTDPGPATDVADTGTGHGTRRYSEQVLSPGEEVYVLGHVEDRTDPDRERLRPGDARIGPPDEDIFVVSTQDDATLESEFGSSYRSLLYGGLAAVVAGLGLVAVVLRWF